MFIRRRVGPDKCQGLPMNRCRCDRLSLQIRRSLRLHLPSVSFLRDHQKDADESVLTTDGSLIHINVLYENSLENTVGKKNEFLV